MDFKFSEEDEAFRRDFRSWLGKNLPRDWHDQGELHDPDTQEEFERRRGWHRKLYDGGWMCIHWPREFGGRGESGGGAAGRQPTLNQRARARCARLALVARAQGAVHQPPPPLKKAAPPPPPNPPRVQVLT